MRSRHLFPLRLKILVTLLFVVTAVVTIIMFTMAGLFHEDKQAYITDLTRIVAESTAEECNSLLSSYVDRLRVCSAVLTDLETPEAKKAELLRGVFESDAHIVSVTLDSRGEEVSGVYRVSALERAGTSKDELRGRRRELWPADSLAAGAVFVGNSTISEKFQAFIVSLVLPDAAGDGRLVASAVIRLEALMRIAGRPSAFTVYLVSSDGILLAHRDASLVARRMPMKLPAGIRELRRHYTMGVTRPLKRDNEELLVGYQTVDVGGVTAAAEIPKSTIYVVSRSLLRSLFLVSIALLLFSILLSEIGSRYITRPLQRLMAAARRIGSGDFDIHVDVRTGDEITTLAGAFNQMAHELASRERALEEAHRQLVQSEKMAAFGQIGAGIAHEVKNPLAGILGCAQLSLRKVEGGSPLQRNLELIEKETKRCKAIVENLLKFARQEKSVKEPTEINDVIRDACAIVNHQLELKGVRLEADLAGDLPPVVANANQIQQVIINLLINAQQAMGDRGGSVKVVSRRVDERSIEITVADTGPGIPPEIQSRVFEPFFTTKPSGRGTGLGLSVSFGIIRDHKGEISLSSVPGEGATFTIALPAARENDAQESTDAQVA
jgi:signal transduction histidine kinase